MKKPNIHFLLIATLISFTSKAQNDFIDSLKGVAATQVADTNKVNTLLMISLSYLGTAPDETIAYGVQARDLASKLKFQKGEAFALKNIGLGYFYKTEYLATLDAWQKSIELFKAIGDKNGVANLLSNIGSVYSNQADEAKALDYYLQSLKIAEEINHKLRMATVLQNVGNIYMNKSATYRLALSYLLRALPLSEELDNKEAIITTAANLGLVYFKMNKIDSAFYYYNRGLKISDKIEIVQSCFILNEIGKAYAKTGKFDLAISYQTRAIEIAKRLDAKLEIAKCYLGLADTYFLQGDYTDAYNAYKQTEIIAADPEIHATLELKDAYAGLGITAAKLGNYAEAYNYETLHASIKDTIYNSATDKKLASLQFDFDIQKKQGEINLLTKDKELAALELNKQRIMRNALSGGIALILIIAFVIYRNYRIKVKTNRILDKQKVVIENLLLNILPAEVAQELQTTGQSTPRHYKSVSVLFTDFKGFTTIADKMSPEKLVEELSTCFIAFDNIIEKYGLEKIKTIGDSYMCAGGIPVPDDDHPYKIIKAGIEIQSFIQSNNLRRQALGQEVWDIRIGVHVGPAVAGVVGKKKYAYDIWGSTVNIASRMESNGQPGQVNISADTYALIKDRFVCTHRGKIYAKNVGEIDMYFVESEIKDSRHRLTASSIGDEMIEQMN